MTEVRRHIVKITEWRNGCVYRTKIIGEVWVDADSNIAEGNAIAKKHGGDFLSCMPMEEMAKGYDTCYRTKKD